MISIVCEYSLGSLNTSPYDYDLIENILNKRYIDTTFVFKKVDSPSVFMRFIDYDTTKLLANFKVLKDLHYITNDFDWILYKNTSCICNYGDNSHYREIVDTLENDDTCFIDSDTDTTTSENPDTKTAEQTDKKSDEKSDTDAKSDEKSDTDTQSDEKFVIDTQSDEKSVTDAKSDEKPVTDAKSDEKPVTDDTVFEIVKDN